MNFVSAKDDEPEPAKGSDSEIEFLLRLRKRDFPQLWERDSNQTRGWWKSPEEL